MHRSILAFAFAAASFTAANAHEAPKLEIVWPPAGAVIELGGDDGQTIGVVVKTNFALVQAGLCGDNHECGHIHMKIGPDFGGDLIKARFGHCPSPNGTHVIGILLADSATETALTRSIRERQARIRHAMCRFRRACGTWSSGHLIGASRLEVAPKMAVATSCEYERPLWARGGRFCT